MPRRVERDALPFVGWIRHWGAANFNGLMKSEFWIPFQNVGCGWTLFDKLGYSASRERGARIRIELLPATGFACTAGLGEESNDHTKKSGQIRAKLSVAARFVWTSDTVRADIICSLETEYIALLHDAWRFQKYIWQAQITTSKFHSKISLH